MRDLEPPSLRLPDRQLKRVVQPAIAEVPADGNVVSLPKNVRVVVRDALRPVTVRAHRATCLELIDLEEHPMMRLRRNRQARAIDRRRDDVAYPNNLCGLQRLRCERVPEGIPFAVIEHRTGAVALQDRIESQWELEYELKQLATLRPVADTSLHAPLWPDH